MKIFNFRTDMYFKIRGVKNGDFTDTVNVIFNAVPEFFNTVAKRGNSAHSGYNNSLFFHCYYNSNSIKSDRRQC